MLTPVDQRLVADYYDALKRSYGNRISEEGAERIHKAYLFACDAHAGVKRRSGEPYIIHPIAVATIASGEIGLGATAIVASLLHDVIEDTEYTYEEIANLFGKEVAKIVDGLTKLSNEFTTQKDSPQALNFRKMLHTLSDDVRVMLIKLADRLHNMRTLDSMPPAKQIKISSETLYMFSPLAHRLGLYTIKTELEDLCLKYTEPEAYKQIQLRLHDQEEQLQSLASQFVQPIEKALQEEGFHFKITKRLKSIYSIWNKMKKKNVSFDEIYDILAIRIIFKPNSPDSEKRQCFEILAKLNGIYKHKPGRIRDWINTPKANGYEALHVTLMSPKGRWIETQIRTERMDEIAERGFAAHYKYKDNPDAEESELDRWLANIRETLSHTENNAEEFVDEFKMNLYATEIMAFSPKGEMFTLPKDSCIIDFAYEIHSDLGFHCIGAKINNELVPVSYRIKNGDQVNVLTSKTQKPKQEWLQYIRTSKAKNKLKQALRAENKMHVIQGRKKVEKVLRNNNIKVSNTNFDLLSKYYNLPSKDQLFIQVSMGKLSVEEIENTPIVPKKNVVKQYFSKAFGLGEKEERDLQIKEEIIDKKVVFIIKEHEDEGSYLLASCCSPIPGDNVVGYLDAENHVSIHKQNCEQATKLISHRGDNIIAAQWSKFKKKAYPIQLHLSGFDRVGLLNEITSIISKLNNIIINSIDFNAENGVFFGNMLLSVHNLEDLNVLKAKLAKVKGIDRVDRLEKEK